MHYFGGLQFQQRKLRSRLRSNGCRWGHLDRLRLVLLVRRTGAYSTIRTINVMSAIDSRFSL